MSDVKSIIYSATLSDIGSAIDSATDFADMSWSATLDASESVTGSVTWDIIYFVIKRELENV